ncbi:MAG: thiamine pyrophosphate-binding protein [Chloroflexi bacterium]|nr:thiamine pyrophosphate-binding protein [Chloroflexota bacterium]
MPRMSGAQALARQLRSEGVDAIFTLPGVQIMAAFDALYDLRDDIQLVHTRHEQATTYMADGYSKATGKVGVAMVVPGPGALNATAGLGTAFASSSPVLLVSGQIASNTLGKRQGQLHEVEDQLDVFKPITKWNHRVTEVGEIPEAVHEAFRQLTTGRPRPVELEVPPDTLAALGDADIIEPEVYPSAAADADAIRRAAEVLARAERPAIIAGGGTIISGAADELREVAEFLQASVMTTQQGKGALPNDHDLMVGVNYALVEPVKHVLPDCDALLAVGTRLLFRAFEPNSIPPIVHIDADATEIGKNLPTEVGIVGDAKQALRQLLESLRAISAPKESRSQEIAGYRQSADNDLDELASDQLQIIQDIRGALDDDDILVSGMTNIGYWSHVAYPVNTPRTYLTSSYFGTLGYAYPTALGAKVGMPDKRVVALCGDGGFMYNIQELSTAARYGINAVAVVFNNHAYGASMWDQTHQYGERFIGTDLNNPDFLKVAEAFGVTGMKAEPANIGEALHQALQANAPVLLEVELPNMMPPFQIVR